MGKASTARLPCRSCPWRVDQDARSIPGFVLSLAEGLAVTCASERGGESVGHDEPQFACHQSRDGDEIVCAGWLAVEGSEHVGARLAVAFGKHPPDALRPGDDWPELHDSYAEVIEKLRRTDPARSATIKPRRDDMTTEPPYPTMDEVERADAVSLTRWVRYLPSPTDAQRDIMDRIIARRQALSDGDKIAASKEVGWDALP
jgi:hypothetical protein